MTDIDQSRFDKRLDGDFLTSAEAASLLGVKPATLYTYVSRGLLRSAPDPSSRRNRYLRADVERLRDRARARSGQGPVAADALHWGEPVLDTRVGSIEVDGPRYRGRSAVELATTGATVSDVAALLWDDDEPWELLADEDARGFADELATLVPEDTLPLDRLALALPFLAAHDPARFEAAPAVELARARRLIPTLAAVLGLGSLLADPQAPIAHRAAVLSADHGLNASTFAARVTASTGADLYACLIAGVAALSGPRHGGACERIEALLRDAEDLGPERAVHLRLRRGEAVPGFRHPLYPDGDPRTAPLMDVAKDPTADGVIETMAAAGFDPPTLDFGLVAVARTLKLPSGGATALFALGRSVGWVAHILEQRTLPGLLRPRARYVG